MVYIYIRINVQHTWVRIRPSPRVSSIAGAPFNTLIYIHMH